MRLFRLVAVVGALFAAAPAAAQCDWATLSAGQWCEVPSSTLAAAVPIGQYGYFLSSGKPYLQCGDSSSTAVSAIMTAWSGGVYDSGRQKLVVYGGGHADYCGNELWEFDINTLTWALGTPPDPNATSGTTFVTASGRPKSMHTYDLPVYVPSLGQFCQAGIQAPYPSGNGGTDAIWCNNPSGRDLQNNTGAQGWYEVNSTVDQNWRHVHTAYYDGYVYIDSGSIGGRLYRWNTSGSTVTLLSGASYTTPSVIDADGEIDPVNGKMLVFGNGTFYEWNIATGVKASSLATMPTACTGRKAPGWEYDTALSKFVAWCGGADTYTYSRTTNTWQTCTAVSGAPGNMQTNGTYGRFSYVPSKNGYVLVNSTTQNVYLYRLPASCGGAGGNCGNGVCDAGETTENCPNDCINTTVLSPGPTTYDYSTPTSIAYKIQVNLAGPVPTDSDYDATVTVRYRVSPSGQWIVGVSPSRIRPSADLTGNVLPVIEDHFGGAIWGLTPGTSYDIEYTFVDPDGYNQTRTDTHATYSAPSTAGAVTYQVATRAALQELLDGDGTGDAQAGQHIQVTASISGDAASALATIGVSGSPGNPIWIRCTSRSIVLNAASGRQVFDILDGSSYLQIENCTLTGAAGTPGSGSNGFQIKGRGSHTDVVIRENIIRSAWNGSSTEWGGVDFDDGQSYGLIVQDNLIEGPFEYPTRDTSATKGVKLQGEGLTVARNIIRGMGDSISFSDDTLIANRNVVIYGNDIQWAKDDCIQADYTEQAAIHNNRCANYLSCVSLQPTDGGPIYFVRNVCWSSGMSRHLKIDSSPGQRINAGKFWNNIITIPWANYSSTRSYSMEFINNLWVGTSAATTFVFDGSMEYQGLHDGATGTTSPDAIINYNAYNFEKVFDVGNCSSSTFAGWRSTCGFDLQGQIVSEPIFATTPAYPVFTGGTHTFSTIPDPRPHGSSTIIGAAATIHGVTSTYLGGGPDIGAYEAGDSLYPYGLETWSYTLGHCQDGIDNDLDGVQDLADAGCLSSADPSEKDQGLVCDNGIDEDNDELWDYPEEPGCVSRCDTTETTVTSEMCSPPSSCGNGTVEGGEQCEWPFGPCCEELTCLYLSFGTACTSDENGCTTDQCNGASASCIYTNNSASCDDGIYCNGTDTCSGGSCAVHAGNPCPGADGDTNCAETCNESADTCTANDPDGSACGDQTSTTCDAPNTCATGTCAVNYAANGTSCDDGIYCFSATHTQAADTCQSGACTGGGQFLICEDFDVCTDDSCNEPSDSCLYVPDPTNDPSCTRIAPITGVRMQGGSTQR